MQGTTPATSGIDIPARQGFAVQEVSIRDLGCKLKENSFNPSKDSPPNEFLAKLNIRYSKYYASPLLRTASAHEETK